MARKLAHTWRPPRGGRSDGRSGSTGSKAGLNRREYLRLGAVAAAALGVGAGLGGTTLASDDEELAFATNFSEYSR